MVTIKFIKARQIFNSSGKPVVEVEVTCSDGSTHTASTGIYEALELRDGGSDYLGKGVLKVVDYVNTVIGPPLVGMDPTEQIKIDNFMSIQSMGLDLQLMRIEEELGSAAGYKFRAPVKP